MEVFVLFSALKSGFRDDFMNLIAWPGEHVEQSYVLRDQACCVSLIHTEQPEAVELSPASVTAEDGKNAGKADLRTLLPLALFWDVVW
jgi:hypothetical protein